MRACPCGRDADFETIVPEGGTICVRCLRRGGRP